MLKTANLPDRLWQGALLIATAELMFALMGASIRVLSADLNNGMIVFARNIVGLGLLLALTLHPSHRGLATRVPHLHLLRALAGLGAMYCFFYAIANMPLANAMLLKLTAPLFIPLVALAWLDERFTWHVVAALAIGFSGVGLILTPDFAQFAPVTMVALLGGALAAVAKVTVRRLSRTEPAARTVFYFAAIASAVSLLPLLWMWQTPTPRMLGWMLILGILATAGQFLLTRGMACAPAARLGPFAFLSVVFGALLGWFFWDEVLYWSTAFGALLVLASGLIASAGRQPRRPEVGTPLEQTGTL
ncbi:MAG: DMT family transporter [Gammaproteobacteria bacterium]|nr:DMT family transporter [Gammaproteobacteria bacterium]